MTQQLKTLVVLGDVVHRIHAGKTPTHKLRKKTQVINHSIVLGVLEESDRAGWDSLER